MVVLYILLFLVCLSLLVMIHELGHLVTAKAFKVYCFEYSFGFGPKLFSRKRKDGETYFSIRAIPFGGFVSMYDGETPEDTPEGLNIPKERALSSIHKGKRAVVLVAGVVMNAILGLLVYLISNTCFLQRQTSINVASVKEDSAIYETIKDDEYFNKEDKTFNLYTYNEYLDQYKEIFVIDPNARVELEGEGIIDCFAAFDLTSQLSGYDKLEWYRFLAFYRVDDSGKINDLSTNKLIAGKNVKEATFNFSLTKSEDGQILKGLPHEVKVTSIEENQTYHFSDIGICLYLHEFRYGFGEAVKQTFVDFGDASGAIVKALGSLFTSKSAREGMGGLIAIGFVTTDALTNFGFNSFLRLWAMISINLAIINLVPYPGLDGWQLLVLGFEAIFRKEMPKKVKNIVSFVGMIILFGLMILLIVKDIFKFIIH